jgi:outer membrane protein TolC
MKIEKSKSRASLKKFYPLSTPLLVVLFFSNSALAITLNEYLDEVRRNNKAVTAAHFSEKSANLSNAQGALLTAPQFFATALSSSDKSPTIMGALNGTERQNKNLQSGFQMSSVLGLQGRIYYAHDEQKIIGSSFIPPEQDTLNLESYNIELKLPIWQNGFGRDVRFQKNAIEQQAKAESTQARFENESILLQAEIAYFKLSKLQQEREVLFRLKDQGEKLVSWTRNRSESRLLEKSNLNESVAALAGRDLELKRKILEYEDALKEFNSIREVALDTPATVTPLQEQLSSTKIRGLTQNLVRLDLKSHESAIESERSSLERSKEALKPKIDLSTKFATFKKQNDLDDTSRCTDSNACSQFVLGINFEMPLDFGSIKDARSAADFRVKAREAFLIRARSESNAQLVRLQRSLELIDQQIVSSDGLIKAQQDRLAEERKRQKLGRGSTFDIIRAEQDLSQSELYLIQLQFSKLEALSSLRLFVPSEEL